MKKLVLIGLFCFGTNALCQDLKIVTYKKQPLKIIEESISELDCRSIDKLLQLREIHFHMIYSPANGKVLSVKPNYRLMKAIEESNPNFEFNWEIIDQFSNTLQNRIKIKDVYPLYNLLDKSDQSEVIILFLNESKKFRRLACQ